MDERYDRVREAVLHGGYRGFIVLDNADNTSRDGIAARCFPLEIEGTAIVGLWADFTFFGVRRGTSWPRSRQLLDQIAGPSVAGVRRVAGFPASPPDTDRETITVYATVSYGSSQGDWGDDAVLTKATTTIERRRANQTR